ncbi:MAG: YifB family Mg chelatase-like AAA ATPase [Planctomycetota bacterium]
MTTGMVVGVDAEPIQVEATARSASDGTPRILGLVDATVREAYHRVLNAFFALGLPSPRGVTTVNFAPASLRKRGHGFDLPLALALAGAGGMWPPERARGLCAFGEISLRGRVLPARGIVSVALMARARGHGTLLCSPDDAALCEGIADLQVLGAPTVADALYWVAGRRDLPPPPERTAATPPRCPDLADLRGHETPKRALCAAAAGGHNLLFVGPPGSGKTALCRRLPGLLPPCSDDERLQILQVHAAAGLPEPGGAQRPLRAPHHTSSTVSLLGGGADVRPGEVTLAHHGVLFLDELPEFRRDALEALRQPLEDGIVTVGRASGTVTMPAAFALVAAMNPCPCGYLGHPARPCTCTPPAVQRYRRRLSGPLLDRLDLQVEVPALDPLELQQARDPAHGSERLRHHIAAARAFQRERNGRLGASLANARLADRILELACPAGPRVHDALLQVLRLHRAGARARVRLLRVARTLADLDQRPELTVDDVLEAAALRGFARQGALP